MLKSHRNIRQAIYISKDRFQKQPQEHEEEQSHEVSPMASCVRLCPETLTGSNLANTAEHGAIQEGSFTGGRIRSQSRNSSE